MSITVRRANSNFAALYKSPGPPKNLPPPAKQAVCGQRLPIAGNFVDFYSDTRQIYLDAGAHPWLGVDVDESLVLFHDAIYRRQTESCPFFF